MLDFPARVSRTCNLDSCLANGIDVSDARCLLGKTIHGEVFPETSGANLRSAQFCLPDGIMRGGIQEYCLTGRAMMPGICLRVTFKVRGVEPARLRTWLSLIHISEPTRLGMISY